MLIYLSIYSNKNETLNKVFRFINKVTKQKLLKIKIFSKQYRKIKTLKRFTVLKSPHVNKKAQEHFKLCKQQYYIKLDLFQINFFFIVLKKLQTQLFPDIFVKVKVYFLDKQTKKTLINPNSFKFESAPNLIITNTINYVKILDTFGELGMKK